MDTAYRLPMAGQSTDIEHGNGSEILAASRDELDVLGRFITKDPSEERGGLNLYRFCRNNGVNACDRLGLMTFSGPKEGDHPPNYFNYFEGCTLSEDLFATDPIWRYYYVGWDRDYSVGGGQRLHDQVNSGAYACAEAMNALMDQNMGYNSGQAWADLNSRADEAEARQENPEATVTAGTYAVTYHRKSGTTTGTVDGQLVAFGTDSGFSAVLDQIGGGWNVAGGFAPNSAGSPGLLSRAIDGLISLFPVVSVSGGYGYTLGLGSGTNQALFISGGMSLTLTGDLRKLRNGNFLDGLQISLDGQRAVMNNGWGFAGTIGLTGGVGTSKEMPGTALQNYLAGRSIRNLYGTEHVEGGGAIVGGFSGSFDMAADGISGTRGVGRDFGFSMYFAGDGAANASAAVSMREFLYLLLSSQNVPPPFSPAPDPDH